MQTALAQSQVDSRLKAGMARLLYRLRDYMCAIPLQDDAMPEHDLSWEAPVGRGGPDQVILDAIKMTPELWAGAIPNNCCIVHRETLAKYVGADAAEYMAGYGTMAVEDQAARCRHEADLCEQRR